MAFERACSGRNHLTSIRAIVVIKMDFDYYYGPEAETYAFYRIPKVLFTEEHFSGISTEAKVLYGILLDRMNLSAKNGWVDEKGRVYIICTIKQVMGSMGCAEQKAVKLLNELEANAGLIEKVRQGQGKPSRIYVKNFIHNPLKSQFRNDENHNSGVVNITIPEPRKSQCNNTDINNTEFSDNNLILSGPDEMDERKSVTEYFHDSLDYDALINDYPFDKGLIDEMVEILVDTVCSGKARVMISGDYKPIQVVKGKLMKLDMTHIAYVLNCFKENGTKVKNIRAYLLSSLYNAPSTINAYYTAMYQNDRAEGRI